MVSLQPVEPAAGPAPRGPYSAGIRAGGLLFVSGQIAIAPDGRSLADADLETQTRQCLANLRAVLDAGGATLQQVAKVTVYMAEPDGWPLFNRLYAEFFGPHRPARAIVPVPAFPGGFKVECSSGPARRLKPVRRHGPASDSLSMPRKRESVDGAKRPARNSRIHSPQSTQSPQRFRGGRRFL